jgi:hypothetical protein
MQIDLPFSITYDAPQIMVSDGIRAVFQASRVPYLVS